MGLTKSLTKGQIEAEISKIITQWEKDFLGRGSLSVKTDIMRNMIIVNLKGIMTPAEYKLCDTKEGLLTIKRMRCDLVESGVQDLRTLIEEIIGTRILSFFTDLSTKTGERLMVFKLDKDYETKISKG